MTSTSKPPPSEIVGLNGVAVPAKQHQGKHFRTYEVYQRERVGESTEKISPTDLVSEAYALDPFTPTNILREHYPCYRDWLNNCYWISRYDDVTSLFTDEANFASRTKLWRYDMVGFGNDLGQHEAVVAAWANGMDHHGSRTAEELINDFSESEQCDLAIAFAARYPLDLLANMLALPAQDVDKFSTLLWQAQRGVHWQPIRAAKGKQALLDLVRYFTPLIENRRNIEADDLVTTVANIGGSAEDLVTTLLEADHETLHGALANLWCALLQDPNRLAQVRSDRSLLKVAYLETLRHSPSVLTANRYARHEVERFGRLLPAGALMRLSAAGANRDPQVFNDADTFLLDRKDMCQREARGQYRADGLATGIAFGLGKPSIHPAIPEDRPRSLFALTRDTAITASQLLLDKLPNLRLQTGAAPTMRCLGLDELYACWSLPVNY